jgi:organic radical activating enzyme
MSDEFENKAFCIVPWTHTYISPQSERRLCCASREQHNFAKQYLDSNYRSNGPQPKYKPTSLKEYWNSESIRNIRLKMLNGEIPDECMVCHEKELTLETYKDYFTKELFPDLVKVAIENTDPSGNTTMKPRSYDYRFNNKCNFSCRMCGEQLSSRWEKEKLENNMWSKENDPWLIPEFKKDIKKFQEEVVEKEFLSAIDDEEIEEIYWVGGEPLLWEIHWKSVSKLIENGTAANVVLRYNTNLSITEFRTKNLFKDIFPHFKKVIFMPSLDATEEIGEYIRTGLNWNKWLVNLLQAKKYSETHSNMDLILDLTLTLPGLFGLKKYIDLSNKLNIPVAAKLVYAFDPSIVLSPLALPRPLLEKKVNELIEYNFKNINKNNKNILKLLSDIKNRRTHQEKYPDNWKSEFFKGRSRQLKIEEIRKDKFTLTDIYKADKEILDWWVQSE